MCEQKEKEKKKNKKKSCKTKNRTLCSRAYTYHYTSKELKLIMPVDHSISFLFSFLYLLSSYLSIFFSCVSKTWFFFPSPPPPPH